MGLQFLDLHDLTDNDKRHIITILKADATEALKLPWDAKDIEGNNNNVNSVTVTEVPELQQHHWYNGEYAAFISMNLLDKFVFLFLCDIIYNCVYNI